MECIFGFKSFDFLQIFIFELQFDFWFCRCFIFLFCVFQIIDILRCRSEGGEGGVGEDGSEMDVGGDEGLGVDDGGVGEGQVG